MADTLSLFRIAVRIAVPVRLIDWASLRRCPPAWPASFISGFDHRDPGSCEDLSSGAHSRDPSHHAALHAQDNLLNWIRLIWVVQSPSQKYSGSLLTQITSTTLASRPTQRGVSRSSRT